MQGEDCPPSPEQGGETGVDETSNRSRAATTASPVSTVLLAGTAIPQCTSHRQLLN